MTCRMLSLQLKFLNVYCVCDDMYYYHHYQRVCNVIVLSAFLQASKTAQQETSDQLLALQKERDKRIEEWQEINKVSTVVKISDKYQTDSIKIEFYLFQNNYI